MSAALLSRRDALRNLALVALAGPAAVAIGAAHDARAAAGKTADVALCRAEAEIRETEAALARIFATDFEGTPAEAEAYALSSRWCRALHTMTEMPAAGPDGLAAKARVVGRLAEQRDFEMMGTLAPSLAADALRLRVRA